MCSLINNSKQGQTNDHHHLHDHEEIHADDLKFGKEEIAIARKHINTLFPLANMSIREVVPMLFCFKKSHRGHEHRIPD